MYLNIAQIKMIDLLLENSNPKVNTRWFTEKTGYTASQVRNRLLDMSKSYATDPLIKAEKVNRAYFWNLSLHATSHKFVFIDRLEKMKKEKNILRFYFSDNIVVKYDFIKHSLIDFDKYLFIEPTKTMDFEKWVCLYLVSSPRHILPEWIFSYPDLISLSWERTNINTNKWATDLPQELPKGYIPFCIENNLYINFSSYQRFNLSMIFNYSKKILTFVDRIISYDRERLLIDNIIKNPTFYTELFNKIYKIYMYSASWCESISFGDMSVLASRIALYPEWIALLDTNRGISFNYGIISQKMEAKKNKILAEQLQKLNFINNMIIDDYIIKVPQSIDDLTDEGKQQNNCVGYYYNNSIIEKRNLIYFIRKKESPEKSFVTCRFNIAYRTTEEHRYKNNAYESELENIRNIIDQKINDNIKIITEGE